MPSFLAVTFGICATYNKVTHKVLYIPKQIVEYHLWHLFFFLYYFSFKENSKF